MRGGPAVRGARCAAAAASGRGSVVRCGDIGRPISPAEATAANVRSIAAFAIFAVFYATLRGITTLRAVQSITMYLCTQCDTYIHETGTHF